MQENWNSYPIQIDSASFPRKTLYENVFFLFVTVLSAFEVHL